MPQDEPSRDVYSHSKFSHAAPIDLQKITPAEWTIEISVKPKRLHCGPQTFVCRDGWTKEQPWLVFQITDRDQFAITFADVEKRLHEAVAAGTPLQENHWYHLAAVSDGRTLKLYADCQDGRGYELQASTDLPKTGSTALGKSSDNQEWAIGRVRTPANHLAQWFRGWIDELRSERRGDSARGFPVYSPRQGITTMKKVTSLALAVLILASTATGQRGRGLQSRP